MNRTHTVPTGPARTVLACTTLEQLCSGDDAAIRADDGTNPRAYVVMRPDGTLDVPEVAAYVRRDVEAVAA
ncbi:hypothetical protein CLV56_3994 [Mumia flava]|uniref:Uncharacterized protein n=1 Tax=Mumia flava TaxID=1348852 RepID=A0A0B2BT47_9ACTN|nr:hypothetical protein [Mumia flava]PJJ48289.1 hypothetical protein CLV56_3994 [Mumia flava]